MAVPNIGQVFKFIEFYASIVATPGVSDQVKELSNKSLESLLKIIEPEIDELKAGAAGIIL